VVKTLTNRPFAINHIPQALDAEVFRYTLKARARVISFTLGDPGDLVQQAHAVGARVMLQITTVAQAVEAAETGVDVIIAQGGESGGYCGEVSTMALVPQVVDAVSPIPAVASGGIFSTAAVSRRR
jgi:nitronate monooxygenase/enoyl-[acyl-carrier protein] reductase II